MAKIEVGKICVRSGLRFMASPRTKLHPEIKDWLGMANQEGWYTECAEAIVSGKNKGFDSIESFNAVLVSVREIALEAQKQKEVDYAQNKAAYRLEKSRRELLSNILTKNGYRWSNEASEGEEKDFFLKSPNNKIVSISDALESIYSESGNFIPLRKGGWTQTPTQSLVIDIRGDYPSSKEEISLPIDKDPYHPTLPQGKLYDAGDI